MRLYSFLLKFSVCALLLGASRISIGAQEAYPLVLTTDRTITHLVELWRVAAQNEPALATYRNAVAEELVRRQPTVTANSPELFKQLQEQKMQLQQELRAPATIFAQGAEESTKYNKMLSDYKIQKKVELDVVNAQIAQLLNAHLPPDKKIEMDTIKYDDDFQEPYYNAVQFLRQKYPSMQVHEVTIKRPKSPLEIILGDREKVLSSIPDGSPIKLLYQAVSAERGFGGPAIMRKPQAQISHEKMPAADSNPEKQSVDYSSWAKKLATGAALTYLGYVGIKESLGYSTYLGSTLAAARYSLFPKSIQNLVQPMGTALINKQK